MQEFALRAENSNREIIAGRAVRSAEQISFEMLNERPSTTEGKSTFGEPRSPVCVSSCGHPAFIGG